MTPEDKEFARACLRQGRLTIDQVEQIRRTAEGRKARFRDVAAAYGVSVEGRAPSGAPAYGYVLLGTLAVFVAGSAAVLAIGLGEMHRRDADNARRRAELERMEPAPTGGGADTTRQAIEVERRLRQARETLSGVEDGLLTIPEEERVARLEQALTGFDAYLAFRPDAAAVFCDRGRARDLLGRKAEALADYDKAMVLDPGLKGAIEPRAKELRQ
ncbi:MAG: tetratricopeptide repeat protein [Planctomycetes bacterium]|nr:tetratricopeptide repeat protein [Planctomycetota bacterium]